MTDPHQHEWFLTICEWRTTQDDNEQREAVGWGHPANSSTGIQTVRQK